MEQVGAAEAGESRDGGEGVRGTSRARLWGGSAAVLLVAVGVLGVWLWTTGTWARWRAVARVDGERITRGDLEEHLAFLAKLERLRPEVLGDPARRHEAERSALDDLITRRLLLAEAERLKITVEPGEEDMAFNKAHGAQFGESKLPDAAKKAGEAPSRLRQEVKRQLLLTRLAEVVTKAVTVGEDEVASYYEGHRQAFSVPGMVRLRVLIVESQEKAERLRSQVLKGADFTALAREHSKGGAKDRGGDMGWVDPRMLPAALVASVSSIAGTGVTPVVKAKDDYYVLRVEGRQAARQLSLAEVKDQIRQMLIAQKKQIVFTEWLQERRRAARIEVYL